MTNGRLNGRKLPVWGIPRRQAIEPFGSGRVAGLGRPSVPAARLGVILGDAVAVLVHRPQVVHGGGASRRRGFLEPVARLGVVAGDPPAFDVQQPEHVHRLRVIGLGPRRARRGRPKGAVPASGQGVYPAFQTRTGRPDGAGQKRWLR